MIVDRPNRFVLRVLFEDATEQVHLGDRGVLPNLLAPGNEILCSPADDADRVTGYDAVAGRNAEADIGVRPVLANDLFERALIRGDLPWLSGVTSLAREPPLPDHDRRDFLLKSGDHNRTYVEVKSCSLAREVVARWPDRTTERRRRHLRSLERLAAGGTDCNVVFVVQRPDVEAFCQLDDVDPAFADLLGHVQADDVDAQSIVIPCRAPHYHLQDTDLPVELGC